MKKKAFIIIVVVSLVLFALHIPLGVGIIIEDLKIIHEHSQMEHLSGVDRLGEGWGILLVVIYGSALFFNELELIRKSWDLRFEKFMTKFQTILTVTTMSLAGLSLINVLLDVAWNQLTKHLHVIYDPIINKILMSVDEIFLFMPWLTLIAIFVCNTIRLFVGSRNTAIVNYKGKSFSYARGLYKGEISEDNIVGEVSSKISSHLQPSVDYQSNCAAIGTKIAIDKNEDNYIYLNVDNEWFKFKKID